MVVPLQKVDSYVLLTRPPLSLSVEQALQRASYDLHVLSIPPAFILSQDQTLREHKVFYYVTYTTILSLLTDVKPTCLFLIEKKHNEKFVVGDSALEHYQHLPE